MKDKPIPGKENTSRGRGVHGAGGLNKLPLRRGVERRGPPIHSRKVGGGGRGAHINREVNMSPMLKQRLEIIRKRGRDPWETVMDIVRWEGEEEARGLTRAEVYGWDEEQSEVSDFYEDVTEFYEDAEEEGVDVEPSRGMRGVASPPARHVGQGQGRGGHSPMVHSPMVALSSLSGSLSLFSLPSEPSLSSSSSSEEIEEEEEEDEEDEEREAQKDEALQRRVEATLSRYEDVDRYADEDRYAAEGGRGQRGMLAGEQGGMRRENGGRSKGRGRGTGSSEDEASPNARRSASMELFERDLREIVEEEMGGVEGRLAALLEHWRTLGQVRRQDTLM
jgi:hypothetical protein